MASGASEMIVTFPGGKRVDTEAGGHAVRTDQPRDGGGDDSAPAPFGLFLAAIGTCAGIYVLGFCQKRELPTDGIRIRQRNHFDPATGVLARVELDVEVPPSFPEKYRDALVRVADQCAVKKAIQAQPAFAVRTVVADAVRT
jgi:putative redox protein